MKKFILILLIAYSQISFCQCIDKSKIHYGGEWEFTKYQYLCPVYKFVNNGDTSKHWIYINNIDIGQIANEINPIKAHVENQIKKYSGEDFYSRLKFSQVDVVYPDSIRQYIEGGDRAITIKFCKAKYYFYYRFAIDTDVEYNVGIAVNKKGEIISTFNFPSKSQYIPIDRSLTLCKAIEIARKSNKNIDPIESIIVNYDKPTHRFYWLISQKIKTIKEGENNVNQVYIDAANPKIARNQVSKAMVDF